MNSPQPLQLLEPAQRLRQIQSRIESACRRAGREPASIALVGASKTVEAERLSQYLQAGLCDAGENYIQEGVAKIDALGRGAARWHFIGALQSNKAREIATRFDVLHSLDRPSLARALERELSKSNRTLRALLQVKIGGENSKSGCEPGDLDALFESCRELKHLQIAGLMTIGPVRPSAEAARQDFQELRRLRDGLRQKFGSSAGELGELSMGMSGDFEVAIEEGATMVRLGTALFGGRATASV